MVRFAQGRDRLLQHVGQRTRDGRAVAAGAQELPVEVKLINVDATHFGHDRAGDGLRGLPRRGRLRSTWSMPRMAATLTYLRGLKPLGKAGFAFGSHGWAAKGTEEAALPGGHADETGARAARLCFAPDAAARKPAVPPWRAGEVAQHA